MIRETAIRLVAIALLVFVPRASAAVDDPVVVEVGKASLRTRDVERALARMPAYQRRALGDTPNAIRRRVVETMLVPDLLFGEAARERRLLENTWMRDGMREAGRRALIEHLRAKLAKDDPVTEAHVASYYQKNLAHFQAAQRLRLFRILVADETEAERIANLARGVSGLDKWTAYARDHSLDTATKLRGGDLGFVRADGTTDVPQVRVDPALFAAAVEVRDGEIVPRPVPEGDRYAVVWRRGTIPASDRTLDDERSAIVQVLEREHLQAALEGLVDRLRREQLKAVDVDLLDRLPPAQEAPAASAVSRLPAADVSTSPTPTKTERGLR